MRPRAVPRAFALAVVVFSVLSWGPTSAASGIITTFAGGGVGDQGPATAASLDRPSGIAVDTAGNVYVSDTQHNRIRKIAPTGLITTIAGTGTAGYSGDGGPATAANLNSPTGLALDSGGNLYVADTLNNRIRKVTPSGTILTFVGNGKEGFAGDGGPPTSAILNHPVAIALDRVGNLYIADTDNNRIREVVGGQRILTIAGTGKAIPVPPPGGPGQPSQPSATCIPNEPGIALSTDISSPAGVAVDSRGGVFISDTLGGRVRKVVGGLIFTVSWGSQPGGQAGCEVGFPAALAVDRDDNVYVCDGSFNSVRKIDAVTGAFTPVAGDGSGGFAGDGGPATGASLGGPGGVAVDASGQVFIADTGNLRVRRVDSSGIITTVAGNGWATFAGDGGQAYNAQLFAPHGLALDGRGNTYIADTRNARVRVISSSGVITTVAGSGIAGFSGDGGVATSARLSCPLSVAVDGVGNLYISDGCKDVIRKVDHETGRISTVAGNGVGGFSGDGGPATNAMLSYPWGLAIDGIGNLYVADYSNSRIRRVDAATGIITTVAGTGLAGFSGDGGPATSASLSFSSDIAVDTTGNVYIADTGNGRIRRVDASAGIITTVAGSGARGFSGDGGPATSASLYYPAGVTLDSSGNLYIADNNRVRRVDAVTGIVTTIVGNGVGGFSGDGGVATSASLNRPMDVVVDSSGNVYVADVLNDRIRRVGL